jgi:hypothetical protein
MVGCGLPMLLESSRMWLSSCENRASEKVQRLLFIRCAPCRLFYGRHNRKTINFATQSIQSRYCCVGIRLDDGQRQSCQDMHALCPGEQGVDSHPLEAHESYEIQKVRPYRYSARLYRVVCEDQRLARGADQSHQPDLVWRRTSERIEKDRYPTETAARSVVISSGM